MFVSCFLEMQYGAAFKGNDWNSAPAKISTHISNIVSPLAERQYFGSMVNAKLKGVFFVPAHASAITKICHLALVTNKPGTDEVLP